MGIQFPTLPYCVLPQIIFPLWSLLPILFLVLVAPTAKFGAKSDWRRQYCKNKTLQIANSRKSFLWNMPDVLTLLILDHVDILESTELQYGSYIWCTLNQYIYSTFSTQSRNKGNQSPGQGRKAPPLQ